MKIFKICFHVATFLILFATFLIIKPVSTAIYYSIDSNSMEGFFSRIFLVIFLDFVLLTYIPSVILVLSQGFIYTLPIVSLVISAIDVVVAIGTMFVHGIISYVAMIERPYYDYTYLFNIVPLVLALVNVGFCIFFYINMKNKKKL